MELFVVKWNDLYSNENHIKGIYDSTEKVAKMLNKEYCPCLDLKEEDIIDYSEIEVSEFDCIINIKIIKLND